MSGCIIGGQEGLAGFVENPGANYAEYDDGLAEITRVYQGPPINVGAFLGAIPEGTPDIEFSDLKRTNRTRVFYDSGWAFITVTFGGPSNLSPVLRPFRLTKAIVERASTLELSGGLAGLEEETKANYDIKYSTLAHTVEYTSGSDPDEPSKFDDTELPTLPVKAVYISTIDPTIELTATGYLGGGWNVPNGRIAVLTDDVDYQVFYQCIDFERSKDRGDYWQIRETWAALISTFKEEPEA